MSDARDIIRGAIIQNVTRSPTTKAAAVFHALTAANYRIMSPEDVEAVRRDALEEAAKVAENSGVWEPSGPINSVSDAVWKGMNAYQISDAIRARKETGR